MSNLFPTDDPSAAGQAARLLFVNPSSGSALPDDLPIVTISLRVPAIYAARLTVLARAASVSRNTMAQLVIQAGFDGITTHLPIEFVSEMDEAAIAEYQLSN